MSTVIYEQIFNNESTQPLGDDVTAIKEWLKAETSSEEIQRIAIVGQTQIGKNHLLQQLFRHKKVKKNYDYIFYVSMKNFDDLSKAINILEFLGNKTQLDWFDPYSEEDRNVFKGVVKRLEVAANEQKLCIILDDFANIKLGRYKYSNHASCYKEDKIGFFVQNVFEDWFENCQKIFLLHPWQYFQLTQISKFKLNHMVYIVKGTDIKGQKQMIEEKWKGCGMGKSKLKAYFRPPAECPTNQNCLVSSCFCDHNWCQDLRLLCNVPIYCDKLIENFQKIEKYSTVAAAASVLMYIIDESLSDQDLENSSFKTIASFAWEQYANKKYCFYYSDLERAKISNNVINLFFSASLNKQSQGNRFDYVFYFSFLYMQELLAALWLLSTENLTDQLQTHKIFFQNGNCHVLYTFMKEICNQKHLKICRENNHGKAVNNENFKKLENIILKRNFCDFIFSINFDRILFVLFIVVLFLFYIFSWFVLACR